jgi:hypothetical protein
MKSIEVKILLIPIVCAVFATLLFFAQGGVGGGHGDFDFLIFALGFPATLFAEFWAIGPAALSRSYLAIIIWIPAVVNLLAVWLPIAAAIYFFKRHQR